MIDMRSDTVTTPSRAMRQAMARAKVGDDVYGEDPTVRELEEETAARLGKASALFLPSGTMANQAAVLAHTRPGDELWAHEASHVVDGEQGGVAVLAGVQLRTFQARRGELTVGKLSPWLRDPTDVHNTRPRLLWLENTIARTGGVVLPERTAGLAHFAHRHGLMVHIDGSRLWNASVASGYSESELAAPADSLSVCFSKGLGAPVGSALAGDEQFVARARRARKLLGGGMRQAGVIAAAALYAMRHNVDRLEDDHLRARRVAEVLAELPWCRLNPSDVETNMVFANVVGRRSRAIAAQLASLGVACDVVNSGTLRFVTHLDIGSPDLERVLLALRAVR